MSSPIGVSWSGTGPVTRRAEGGKPVVGCRAPGLLVRVALRLPSHMSAGGATPAPSVQMGEEESEVEAELEDVRLDI